MVLPEPPHHILIIVENLPVPFDRRVWLQATTLRQAGYRVSVICPQRADYPAHYEEREGITIYRHPLPLEAHRRLGYLLEYGAALWWQTRLAWRIFRRHRFVAIHACNPPDLIFLVAAPFKLFGVRFLFDHHDLSPEVYEAKFAGRGGLWYRLLRLCEWLTFQLADRTIATNQSYRQIAIERGGMAPERVHVVRSGPDLRRWQQRPGQRDYHQGGDYLIGYVGVMGRQEGIDLLLQAVRHLVYVQRRQDIQFALIGDGPERRTLQQQAVALGVDRYVTFYGRVDDEQLLAILNSVDICVNPDRDSRLNDLSTMNKVLEYMALGKPLVQFDLTEGRASAGEAALYAQRNNIVDLAARMVELLDDPVRRAQMGQIGRQRVEQALAWEHQVPQLLDAYRALLV